MKKTLLAFGCSVVLSMFSHAQTTTTFPYTGSMQTFVVPACVTSITVDARGARGGGDTTVNSPGGRGGRVQCTLAVTPGQTLYIFVGGQGDLTGTAGYNGGGSGMGGSPTYPGGGGGGASDIRIGGITLNDRVVVAGGGGGGTENGGASSGGAGGGLVGGTGGVGGNPWGCTNLTLATGGTQSAGGSGGTSTSCMWNGSNGTFGVGGNAYTQYRSAGGGGGWYGGGGAHNGASGGGGSSYTTATATGVVHTQGYQYGNGYVLLTYANPGGPAPAAVSGSDSVCVGSTQTYSIAPLAGATSYTWTVPAGSVITSGQGTTSINVTAGSTSGNITVYATYPCGNSATTNFMLNISTYPIVYGFATDSTLCAGEMTTLTGSGAVTYAWSGGVTNAVAFTPPSSATYTVIGTNAFGCADTATVPIVVNANPIVALGPDVTQCGDTVCLDAGNPGSAYTWNTGDTTQLSCVTSSGTYMVHVNDVNGCDGYDTVNVTINALPIVQFMMPMIFACADDDSIPMTATPAGGTFSGPGVFGNTFSPNAAGQGYHILTYTYTDSLGCTGTDTSAIYVDLCLGIIGNNLAANITVFPNPGNGTFSLVADADMSNTALTITDAQGRIVYTESMNLSAGTVTTVSVALADGVYMMQLSSDNVNVVKPLIVNH